MRIMRTDASTKASAWLTSVTLADRFQACNISNTAAPHAGQGSCSSTIHIKQYQARAVHDSCFA
jgi:hypothetical protein